MSSGPSEPELDASTEWQWPECPECEQPRQTRCPGCSIPGNHFLVAEYAPPVAAARRTRRADELPLAEHEASESAGRMSAESDWDEPDDETEPTPPIIDSRVWLVCSLCEEAFQPRFYRRCEKCGHDFRHGIEVDDLLMDWPERAVIVAIVLISVLTGLLAYFWMLLR